MRLRRGIELAAACAWGALAVGVVARVPDVGGVTLGDLVPRWSQVPALTLGAALVATLLVRQRSAGLAVLLGLALVGAVDPFVARRRALALAVASVVLPLLASALARRRSMPLAAAALALGACALAAVARWDGAPLRTALPPVAAREAPEGAKSLLVVTVETTRTDAVGCYGQVRPVTPRIDALAAAGHLFTQATAEAPHTHPSIASLVTARTPIEHGSVSGTPFLVDDVTTLADHARAHGYATAGFLDSPWLGEEFGLARGYEHLERAVDLARVRSWLASLDGRPLLLHAHLFHPHGPYELRVDALEAIGGSDASERARARVGRRIAAGTIRAGEVPGRHAFDAEELAWVRDVYLSEVRAMDAVVGELLDLVGPDVVVALAADHGEEFGERGSLHHSHTLYQELVHVPLVVRDALRPPGGSAARSTAGSTAGAPDGDAARRGTRIDDPVGLIDVAPTLLDLAGLPPLPHAAGRSLVPLLRGRSLAARPTVTQRTAHAGGRDLAAIRAGRWKLHVRATGGDWSAERRTPSDVALFDLVADPGETRDLARGEPEVVERLLSELDAWRRAAVARSAGSRPNATGPRDAARRQVSPAVRSELRALGYAR
ncbi:MAG: sulfatase [Planctomycetota bacterium]